MMEKMVDTESDVVMGVTWVVAEVTGCEWMAGR
jgi:hypothetical protein